MTVRVPHGFFHRLCARVPSSCGRIFVVGANSLNLRRRCEDISKGPGLLTTSLLEGVMTKAARIKSSLRASSTSGDSDHTQLISIALFSGIGLLISLVAVLMGIQGAWF